MLSHWHGVIRSPMLVISNAAKETDRAIGLSQDLMKRKNPELVTVTNPHPQDLALIRLRTVVGPWISR